MTELDRGDGNGLTAAGDFEVYGEATGDIVVWHAHRARSDDGSVTQHA